MLPNAFIGRQDPPTDAELAAELGSSKALWDWLLAELAAEQGIADQDWNSYSRKAGWSLRLRCRKRTILYLSPCRGGFRASFALGVKAIQAVRQSGLPARTIKLIDDSKRYMEGTGVRIDVKGPKDIAVVKKLAAAKLGN